ncbi:hypothetical protein AJ79_09816 [Neofusicoccum parvum]|uniref:Uncharacterized protein n=1 Tax=Neofusicoccum parvum TaxID=310453 RepID=A0ACB5SBA4_9PEZI|nr:hypothetical protein AJ79_09816 [Neofusicoccum parvum]GME64945.1 hypothetical protein AJ79_09816 [Neofusicoccum parvum]
MLAATVVEFKQPLELRTLPIPEPAADQILVKVMASSLCNSDLAGWMGAVGATTPYCAGHEPAGVVVAMGSSVKGFSKGDRVGFMPASWTCLECSECNSGNHRFCAKKTPVGFRGPYGGFSQYALADPLSTVKIPDALSYETAAPLLCAGVTAYGALRKISAVQPGGTFINIIGCGGVGHLTIMYAKAMGYRVHAYDVDEDKLRLARVSGADATFNTATATTTDAAAAESLAQLGATIVTTGAAAAYELAFRVTGNHGRIVAVGVPKEPIAVRVLDMVKRDISLIATNQGNKQDLVEALAQAAEHGIAGVHETRRLEQINEGFQELMQGKVAGRLVYKMW